MKPLHWRQQARQDADEAAAWYFMQGGLALELAFVSALEVGADLIARHPASGSMRHARLLPELSLPLRFLPLKGFDRYLIFYLEMPTHIDVIRVWNAARDLMGLAEGTDES